MVLAELYGIKLFTDFFFNRFIDTVISIASSNLLVNLILKLNLGPCHMNCAVGCTETRNT